MCEICHCSPCLSRCPNHEEKEIYKCEICGEAIVEGEEYYEYDGCQYHEECFKDNAVDLLIEAGASKRTAEEEEPDYDPYDD